MARTDHNRVQVTNGIDNEKEVLELYQDVSKNDEDEGIMAGRKP